MKANGVKSIMDTMNDQYVGYHERNGKYFALPYRVHVSGIIYDADLFNENGYYFFKNGTMGAKQADIDAGESGNIGPGPDGVVGTTDDGMPATYNDFVKLLQQMVTDDVIPFTWSGGTNYQRMYAYESVWANYEGLNDYSLNWSFDGTTDDGQTVTETNYAEVLSEQEGRKAAIKFFYDIMHNNKNYSTNALTQAYNTAQFEYVDSINQNKRIAMFMEGGYWENEARTYFDNAAIIDSEMGYGKRDFRLLPIPNFTGTEGIANQTNTNGKEVLLGRENTSIVCIPKKTAAKNAELQLELAKLFLQFVQSREQMSNFVRDTGAVFRPYEFSATAEEFAKWTKFGQNVYSYMQEGCQVVSDISRSNKRLSLYASGFAWSFKYNAANVSLYDPVTTFDKYDTLSVEDCFANVKAGLKKM